MGCNKETPRGRYHIARGIALRTGSKFLLRSFDSEICIGRSYPTGAERATSEQQFERRLSVDPEVWINIGGEVERAVVPHAPPFHLGNQLVMADLDAVRLDGVVPDEPGDPPAAADVGCDHVGLEMLA